MKLAVHDLIHPESIATVIERLARYGYEGIEMSAETRPPRCGEVARLRELHGLECWGGVTRMTGGTRPRPREREGPAGRRVVRQGRSPVRSDLDGDILTFTPSAVGKLEPMAGPIGL